MNNMIVRALSGAVYVALIVGSLLLGPTYFIILMGCFALLGVNEIQTLLTGVVAVERSSKFLDFICVMAVFLGMIVTSFDPWLWAALIVLLYTPLRIIIAVMSHGDNPARSFMYSIFSLVYVAVPLAVIAFSAYISPQWTKGLLLTFIIIWLNDTGAYLTGRAFGRTKLCERLSPKKTWEGFWGGFALSSISGGCGIYLIAANPSLSLICCGVFYGMLISVVGTYGDLFESLIKRRLGVKDSGNIIPGHGGILDRIDSLLAVAPLSLIAAFIFQ